MVRGSTYSTFVDYPGLTQTAAIDALMMAIARESLVVGGTDKNTGVITAVDEAVKGKARTIEFGITTATQGVRVKATQRYGIGERGNALDVGARFCRIMGAVIVAMPDRVGLDASTPSPGTSAPSATTIEERLKALDELFKQGLITEDEYKKKRADLLSKL